MKPVNRYDNERGMALVTGLIFMAILAIMGTAAYLSSSNELLISKNHRMAREAYYASEAGLEEGRGRLRGSNLDANYAGDPDIGTGADPDWSAYILTPQIAAGFNYSQDPEYDSSFENYIPTAASHTNTTITANSLQTDIEYGIKLRHKREYDAEQAGHKTASLHYYDGDGTSYNPASPHTTGDRGSIIYYGYGDPSRPEQLVQFTTSGSTKFFPVEIVRGYGFGGNFGGDDSSKVIEIEVARFPGPPIVAAIYAQGDVTGNGQSLEVDGNDGCGNAAPLAPIYTLDPAVTILTADPDLDGDPPNPTTGPYSPDIAEMIRQLKDNPDIVLEEDQSGQDFGGPNDFKVIYSDTMNPFNVQGLKISNGTGYGLLLVDGNLTLGGGFNWRGLILATGTITYNGGGQQINIQGAVMGANTVDINGGVYVGYNSCNVSNSFEKRSPQVISWRDVY